MLVVVGFLEVGFLVNSDISPFGKLEAGGDFEESSGDEIPNFILPLQSRREGGGLDPAYGGNLATASAASLDRYGSGAVNSYQPIRFGPAAGRILQRLELISVTKVGKRLLDGLIGHGKHPQALIGLADLANS